MAMCGDAQAKEPASEESTYRCGPMMGEDPAVDAAEAIKEGAIAGGKAGAIVARELADELWKPPTDANGTDSSAVWVSRVMQKMGEKDEANVNVKVDINEYKSRLKRMGFEQTDLK